MTPAKALRWQDAAEKGSVVGIQILAWAARLLGRRAARWLLFPIAAWYVAFHPSVWRGSRAYLRRLGGRARLADVYRHVLCFARVTLDRLFMVQGDFRPFDVSFDGAEHLAALRGSRRGALLIVSHLGSFEVMRAFAETQAYPITMLGYFRNARMINSALRKLNPAFDARLIEIRPNDPTFIFEAEARVAAGEMLGTMGDRVGFDGKSVPAPFLGDAARFPTGPYLLAATLGCPVYLAFGIYREPNRYQLSCEPFAERVDLPREGRDQALAAYARRYAARLEARCHSAPDNWFNFYDFWSSA